MNWKELQNLALNIVHGLTDSDLEGEAKRDLAVEMLLPVVAKSVETIDDLVLLIPAGFGLIFKGLVDNPMFDAEQRKWERIAVNFLVEHAYQAVKALAPKGKQDAIVESQKDFVVNLLNTNS